MYIRPVILFLYQDYNNYIYICVCLFVVMCVCLWCMCVCGVCFMVYVYVCVWCVCLFVVCVCTCVVCVSLSVCGVFREYSSLPPSNIPGTNQGCIQKFCQGGANLGYGKKRGGAEALCVRSTPSRGIRPGKL